MADGWMLQPNYSIFHRSPQLSSEAGNNLLVEGHSPWLIKDEGRGDVPVHEPGLGGLPPIPGLLAAKATLVLALVLRFTL